MIVEYYELNDNQQSIIVWYAEQAQKGNGKRKREYDALCCI